MVRSIPAKLKDKITPHQAFTLFCSLICFFSVVLPVLTVSVYPWVDHPVHAALLQIVQEKLSGGSGLFAARYELDPINPYSAMYFLSAPFLFLTPETITKILVLVYIVASGISFRFLLQSLGCDARYVIFILPLLYNFNLSWGFLPFLFSVPLLFILMALLARAIFDPGTGTIFGIAVLLPIIFMCHFFTFITAFLVAGIAVLFIRSRALVKLKIYLVTLLVPSIAAYLWHSRLSISAADTRFIEKAFRFIPLKIKLEFFLDFVLSGDPGYTYRCVAGGIILLGCLHVLLRHLTRGRSAESSDAQKTWNPLRLVYPIVFTGFYLLCPYSALTAVWLPNRVAFLVLGSAIFLLPSYESFARYVIDGLMACFILYFGFHTTFLFLSFERESRGLFRCISAMDPSCTLQAIIPDTRSQWTDQTAYDHADMYYQLRRKGIVHNPFAVLTHMPVKYQRAVLSEEAALPPPVRIESGGYVFHPMTDRNRYFLVRWPVGYRSDLLYDIFKTRTSAMRIIERSDNWIALENTQYEIAGNH